MPSTTTTKLLMIILFLINIQMTHCIWTPEVNTSTEVSYAELYNDGHLRFGLCGEVDVPMNKPISVGDVCYPKARRKPSAMFNLTQVELELPQESDPWQYQLLRECGNTANCPTIGRYSYRTHDQEPYSNLSANHISVGHPFNIVGTNGESDRSNLTSGTVIIDVYVLREQGSLRTAGDVYKGRIGDNLVKVTVKFDTEVDFVQSVVLRFKIFSAVDNSSKPSVTMAWEKDPLRGMVEIPNCWVLFSHKVLLDGKPHNMADMYPRVKMDAEWFLAIKFPSFKKSAAFELVLRHTKASIVTYPSRADEEIHQSQDRTHQTHQKRVVPNSLMADSVTSKSDDHIQLSVALFVTSTVCRNILY